MLLFSKMKSNNITSKKQLAFYIKADYMMGHGTWKPSFLERIKDLIRPNYIERYLVAMRKSCYYSNFPRFSYGGVKYCYYIRKFRALGYRLGFSIGNKCFGYGLVIPHYGTIVVGGDVRCGNYCVLHTSVCITNEKGKQIGDALYASSGCKINKRITLGNNIKICSNSVVNKSFTEDNLVLAGMPAFIKKEKCGYWYEGWDAEKRKEKIEELKQKLNL